MQKLDYGVEVCIGGTLFAGKCLLQLLQTQLINYSYRIQEAQFHISNEIQEGWDQVLLLHSNTCPCQQKTIQTANKIRLATVAMLCDKNDYFLITRRHSKMNTFPKTWVFPGGMVEKYGNLEEECLREVQEETGIEVKSILNKMNLKALYESIYPTKLELEQKPQKQTLCMFYEVKLNQSYETINIKIQEEEVDDYKWIEKNELLEIMNGVTSNVQLQELCGVYPNKYGSGIGEGHIKAFKHSYKNQ